MSREELPFDEQFENDEEMFVPLTIDDMEVEDTSYYFSGTKLLLIFLGLIPYFSIFFLLDIFGQLSIFIITTLIYLLIYQFYLRYVVFEEYKQREIMEELENNKVSDLSYIWEWDKIGNTKNDTGMAYIQSDGITLRRSYIVRVDSGSDVGVPEGHYRNFRETQQQFYRSLYELGMDVKVYNVRKRAEISKSLKDYAYMLRGLDKKKQDALIKLTQLNLDINFLYSRSSDQRYITYYVVVNKNIENIKNFREIIEGIVDKTFNSNIAFFDPHILDKQGVDEFLALYYDVDAVNTAGIHKMDGYKDFNEYVDLVSVVGTDGKEVPVSLFSDLVSQEAPVTVFGGDKTIDDIIQEEETKQEKWDERRVKSYERKEAELMEARKQDKLTYGEYLEQIEKLKQDHLPENFNEIIEMTDKERERYYKRQEEERIKREQERLRAKERERKNEDTKWYEAEEGLETDVKIEERKPKKIVQDDGRIDWENIDEDDDLTIDDLLNM